MTHLDASPASTNPIILTWMRGVLLPFMGNLRLAILLLLIIALASIGGTVIEQGQGLAYYQANYPEDPALFGFLTWKVLLALGLDHVYRTPWFLTLLVLLGASLTACTFTHQLPALKAARQWKLYQSPRQFEKLALSTTLPAGHFEQLETALKAKRYRVFTEGNALYARKGMAGRIGPILVHVSLLLILLSGIIGAFTGFMAQEMIPSGQTFQVQNIIQSGPWSSAQVPKDWGVKVNRFWIDYTPDGSIDQFYSDLSVVDNQGTELDRKTIRVNKPLKYRGVTFYQTDWAIAGVKVRVNQSPVLALPMAPLQLGQEGRLWGTWVPIKPDLSAGVSLVTQDLQGTVVVYDSQGNFAAPLRAGTAIDVEGVHLALDEVVGSTGLQIKADPGIPFLYLGCACLMVGVVMSYVSHSQVWALQDGSELYLGGRTNRAQIGFERELVNIIDSI